MCLYVWFACVAVGDMYVSMSVGGGILYADGHLVKVPELVVGGVVAETQRAIGAGVLLERVQGVADHLVEGQGLGHLGTQKSSSDRTEFRWGFRLEFSLKVRLEFRFEFIGADSTTGQS